MEEKTMWAISRVNVHYSRREHVLVITGFDTQRAAEAFLRKQGFERISKRHWREKESSPDEWHHDAYITKTEISENYCKGRTFTF